MRRFVAAAAAAWLGCGPPPNREQHTVYALVPAREAPADPAEAPQPARSAQVHDATLRAAWLEPLRARDAAGLVAAFSVDCVVRVPGALGPETRTGRDALRGWLEGRVLAWPYRSVAAVYLGPSARAGVDLAAVDLLDDCGTPLARLTAKLHREGTGYVGGEIALEERTAPACGP